MARWIVALALILAGACGGSGGDDVGANSDRLLDRLPADQTPASAPGGTGGSSPVDACGLLIDGEVGGATGGRVGDRSTGTSTTGDPLCTWDVDTAGSVAKVTVIVYEDGDLTFDADKDDPSSEPVTGLGDGAYWHGTVSVLNVLSGERNLAIQVTDPDTRLGRSAKDVAVDLARAALGRLPGAPATTAP